MINGFFMNNIAWVVKKVDPTSALLVDRTGKHTVATTDPATFSVYLSADLQGDFLIRVLLHELGHCAIVSFGLLDEIHKMVIPMYRIDAEEWICNFIADYGRIIFEAASQILGEDAILLVPRELERLIA